MSSSLLAKPSDIQMLPSLMLTRYFPRKLSISAPASGTAKLTICTRLDVAKSDQHDEAGAVAQHPEVKEIRVTTLEAMHAAQAAARSCSMASTFAAAATAAAMRPTSRNWVTVMPMSFSSR